MSLSDVFERRTYRITGLVQGVGFRPTLWHTAHTLSLAGEVWNDAEGVGTILEGPTSVLDRFEGQLRSDVAAQAPLARIDSVTCVKTEAPLGLTHFAITQSRAGQAHTMVTPDAATCRACAVEMFTPSNRRWRYAFTNCTHCGPRFTITRSIPYDRPMTSMSGFPMCPQCLAEYENPADRRFHAQPNACPVCGPQLTLVDSSGMPLVCDDPVFEAVRRLKAGQIVAVKGLGGFHLAVDAHNGEAVARLRARKAREAKPLAVMVANWQSARLWADFSQAETEALTSPARPIVLAHKSARAQTAFAYVADDLNEIGLMIAYTPVHLLLFHALVGAPNGPEWLDEESEAALVMTSANPSGEPLVIDNREAVERLQNIADVILTHNRDIICRCDDSVVRVIDDRPRLVRRARGYTPLSVKTACDMTGIAGMGAALKATAAVGRANQVFVTAHIGDTKNLASCHALKEAFEHLCDILQTEPARAVACDLHPDFYSSRLAQEIAREKAIALFEVQHHHAHTMAVAAEYGLTGDVYGLSLDGVGLGTDNLAWGCEVLHCQEDGTFARLGHLENMPLPGGDAAAREPWRMGVAAALMCERQANAAALWPQRPTAALMKLAANPRLTTRTSSAGRLFDAVAAITGLIEVQSDEAQAAMLLEAAAGPFTSQSALWLGDLSDLWRLVPEDDMTVLSLRPLLTRLIELRESKASAADMSRLFHAAFSQALAALARRSIPTGSVVCLSGGTFLNRFIASDLAQRLNALGYRPYLPAQLPPGDGAVSFGQCAVAHQRLTHPKQ